MFKVGLYRITVIHWHRFLSILRFIYAKNYVSLLQLIFVCWIMIVKIGPIFITCLCHGTITLVLNYLESVYLRNREGINNYIFCVQYITEFWHASKWYNVCSNLFSFTSKYIHHFASIKNVREFNGSISIYNKIRCLQYSCCKQRILL